jgi:BirA family biotin operon repressor/biotin-[acetyl-CoA-carboxylase] ligase
VQLPGETVEGVFKDLDKDGALLLETQTGERRITAGAILRT